MKNNNEVKSSLSAKQYNEVKTVKFRILEDLLGNLQTFSISRVKKQQLNFISVKQKGSKESTTEDTNIITVNSGIEVLPKFIHNSSKKHEGNQLLNILINY